MTHAGARPATTPVPASAAARRARVTGGVALLLGAVLVGCGSDSRSAAEPEDGGGRLEAGGVSAVCPDGWMVLADDKLPENNDAAAVLREDGEITGKVVIQLDFMRASDTELAAIGAAGSYVFGGRTKSRKDIEVEGTDSAKRLDYEPRESTGRDRVPPRGTVVNGTDVVGMDARDKPFLVRIITERGAVPKADVDRLVSSVAVRG
ncbi:hypothetical protein E0L36_10515 [Streptomyces sp. AJS327]|uniref:hypothetical protein n=1 Tax=Streptomyces sp. AJS327 TaxID=2545265 RepID=UPI0015E02A71|nr:hypothetical protein [Streptomyces sp. AJS327]MBA0051307.1 hypothetical protein [Streptomyces sp. AJS327]